MSDESPSMSLDDEPQPARSFAQIEIHPGRRTNTSIRIVLYDEHDEPNGVLTLGEGLVRWEPGKKRETSFTTAEFARLLERRHYS